MRGQLLGRILVMSVLGLAAFSCKQGTESASSDLAAAEAVVNQDPSYAEWAFSKQNEKVVDKVYEDSLYLAGGKAEEFDIVEGDIVADAKTKLHLASGGNPTWPGGIVYYMFDPNFRDQADVERAMKVWNAETGVQFRPRASEQAYVVFISRKKGCWSNLGYTGREQYINLGEGCGAFGTRLHEIGHSLGLNHEQSRRDRDQYITIRTENILPDQRGQFSIGQADIGAYDYNSVMHYGRYAFTANQQATIETKDGQTIGQRQGLSQSDIESVKSLYGTVGAAPGSAGGVLQAGQGTTDITGVGGVNNAIDRNATIATNYSSLPVTPIPAPTTSVETGCAGFGGFDWSSAYVKNTAGTCRDAKTYCTCWRTTASTCGLYLPNGTVNVAGAALLSTEANCKASCEQVARNGATYLAQSCNRQMVLISERGQLELYDYSNVGRDGTSAESEKL